MRTRTMKPLFLIFCLCLSPLLMGQNQNKIQEAMANYDYETAVELINKEPPTIPLLMHTFVLEYVSLKIIKESC